MSESPGAVGHPPQRAQARHDHLGIRLHWQPEGSEGEASPWYRIQAQGWNAQGFNFHSDLRMPLGSHRFRRGHIHFVGSLVWCREGDPQLARLQVVHQHLYQKAQSARAESGFATRVLRLIRAPGLLSEKLQVLASLGASLSEEQLQQELKDWMSQSSWLQYGVRVEDPQWTQVTDHALSLSAVLTSMERWSEAVGKLR